ncbi:2-iminoacetate synthase ThiH [Enterovibrio nigricans]|uniref:2-iminoacetate synthase n=1 Tax=Enterovibrio nigricans DSM 22720 TaxID=1121868 RepID=A0A1T4UA15_9GAMM|nr:2-iminoacetate synthase ThiH [Enterovibrio nigricans]PKF49702.1 2-iminoacetate synthase ThiH [Enterovibrio nigricans]SKA49368.1 2-iminoacetate synthase [Enterovibrio nigricans DSM 22720]
MSFSTYWETQDWDDIRLSIGAKTEADVLRALAKPKRDLEDFKALISPAADAHLENMAQQAAALTRRRFGYTVNFYVPLYLSNLCANACTYCGFSMENRIKRRTLSADEIERECHAIKGMNFDSILLVTGEHQTKVGMAYFREALPAIKRHFSYLAMEVQPLEEAEYAELKGLGLDAVMVYQETYNRATYGEHHLRGNKTDFAYRLDTADRLARAGIDKIGIGALIGLDDWRTDSFFVASHLDYLERTYWRSRYSISFPRLRPCEGAVQPKSVMNDRQLVQLICAYRLLNQEVELSLSTRESPAFRDKVLPLGITTMSAASKTQPGGYADDEPELEQFAVSDERSAAAVAQAVKAAGFDVVWKDWDPSYSG